MKTEYRFFVLGAVLSLVMAFTACVDKNEWLIDESTARLFRVTDAAVTVDITDATVTWTAIPNTEYYIIELSKDSLHDGIEMGAASNLLYGTDKSITKSPYVISGLEGNTKYYFRIKCVSETKESKWAYLEKWYFETKGEQIFVAPIANEDITSNSVVLRWNAGSSSVTHIILSYEEDGVVKELPQIDLTAEDITAGFKLVDGLQEATTYTANIYNGEIKRGTVSFRTAASVPEDNVTRRLEGTDIVGYLDTVTVSNLTLIVPEGNYETIWVDETGETVYALKVPDNITSLVLQGEGNVAIKTGSVRLGKALATLRILNINFTANESGDYIVNESATTPISEISLDGCTISGFRGVLRMQNAANSSNISYMAIRNCIIHDIGGYGLISSVKNAVTLGDILVENNTLYNFESTLIAVGSKPSSLIIKNTTFHKAVNAAGKYYITFDGAANVPPIPDKFRFESCIFATAGSADGQVRATNPGIKDQNFCVDAFATSDCYVGSGYPLTGVTPYAATAFDLFVDPDNGDFHIKDNAFPGKGVAGDPRWW